MPDVILHHYPQSPVSEKIRVVLGIKGLDWRSVEIPRLPLNQVLLRNRQIIGVEWGGWAGRHPADNAAMMARVMDLIAAGRLHPVEPTAYPLERTIDALRDLAERRAAGKLVIVP